MQLEKANTTAHLGSNCRIHVEGGVH